MDNSTSIKEAIQNQLGTRFDMLENAINMCPDEQWDRKISFWYNSNHCIFWTDYYLTTQPNKFEPPFPFTFSEFDPTGKKPNRTYTKAELFFYLEHCSQKANLLITSLTAESLKDCWVNDYKNFSLLEILLYNQRHIQHHSAQLNLLLRQANNKAPTWLNQEKKYNGK